MDIEVNNLTNKIKTEALNLGFSVFGVTCVPVDLRKDYYLKWLKEGQLGTMEWMNNNNERRLDPLKILPEANSIICLGFNYYQPEPERRGRIAKYALGLDYHNIMIKKLKQLCKILRDNGGINKPYVDTGPVLEKPVSVQAGLGWQSKSTIVINKNFGTWLLLGEILTSLKLSPDIADSDHCGKCTACIDVCPTKAITAPYQLDARRCIAYLTIEHKGSIPEEFRKLIGDHLFGCDDCLDICPWNKWAKKTDEEKCKAREYPDLTAMLKWNEEDFKINFKKTPIYRLGLERLQRNICVVLGNIGEREDFNSLENLKGNCSSMVSEHADWAISQIKNRN